MLGFSELANPREPYPFTIEEGTLYQLVDDPDTESWSLWISPLADMSR